MLRVKQASTIEERLDYYSIPEPNTGCLLWFGATIAAGYGLLRIAKVAIYAHRAQWERFNGPIPEGMEVCHKCDMPPCINPDHLFLGTHADNMRDCRDKGRMTGLMGEDSPNAKLTEEQVLLIREAKGLHREIAAEFGLSTRYVGMIKNRDSWKHLA